MFALRTTSSPKSIVILGLSNATEATGTGATTTVQVADFPPAVAVIVAVPSPFAVTTPFESTVAIAVFELFQVTVLFVALLGDTVAFRVSFEPMSMVVEGLLRDTDATDTGLTVTVHEADLPPAVAVMVTVPTAFAVTTPLELTVATLVLELFHVTVPLDAFDGETVALIVVVEPTSTLVEVGLTVIAVTTGFVTVTLQVADLPSQEAVITAVPAALAVTTPVLLTVATDVFELFQLTVGFVVSEGRTVAFSVPVVPAASVIVVLLSDTESAVTVGEMPLPTQLLQGSYFPAECACARDPLRITDEFARDRQFLVE